MKEIISIAALLAFVLSCLNLVVYSLGFNVFIEELYIVITFFFTIVMVVIRRVPRIEGIYKGSKNLNDVAAIIVWTTLAIAITSCFVSKEMSDSAYFWLSSAMFTSAIVFFSFYVGKTFSGSNWFSFQEPDKKNRRSTKKRMKVR